jgi:NADPH-dependent 2,4-dienoyl-CoA reductase/sulfur reductase-like enzyme/ferredoxin
MAADDTRFPNYLEVKPAIPPLVWSLLRGATLVLALGFAAGFILAPQPAAMLFWNGLVPVLPILVFLAPGWWRNICPLATVNQIPRVFGFSLGRELPHWLKQQGYLIAVGALIVIVVHRKIGFNDSGENTGLLLSAFFVLALLGGILFKGKSGWCSNICPMLPIERLYGQAAFLSVRNSHCRTCVACTRNCHDFNPAVAALADHYEADRQYAGRRKLFAGALPGLLLAYFALPVGPDSPLLDVYLGFAWPIAASAGLFFALDAVFPLRPNQLPALYGVAALNLFYGLALPLLLERWAEAPPVWILWAAQSVLALLSAVWLIRAYRREAAFAAALPPSAARTLSVKTRSPAPGSPGPRPLVTIAPGDEAVPADLGMTLLSCLESQGRNVEAGCRMGICGADPVAILAGMDNLSPMGREEQSTLRRLGLAGNTRMACCARIKGPVSISLEPEQATALPSPVAEWPHDRAVASVVIIGSGIAGVTAADHVRRYHPDCQIHLIGREKHYLYNRMGISRLIYGRSAMQGLYLLPESWYGQHGVTCWVNTQAVAIDRAERRVRLATGEDLAYDRLILAMGSRSRVPAVDGFGLEGSFVLRDADDAMRIRAYAQQHECRRAIVAGGGLLGLEAGYALHRFGLQVSILERSGRLLSRQIDCRASQILRDFLERMGMEVLLKAEAAAVLGRGQFAELLLDKPALKEFFGDRAQGSGRVTQVLLRDGRILPGEVFLTATGIEANAELARAAGLEIGRGVRVDAAMRTSDPDIYAVGDVAEFQGRITGLWSAAVEQAEVAAINSVGGDAAYTGSVAAVLLKVVGIDLYSAGQFEPEADADQAVILEDMVAGSEQRNYRKLVIREGRIVGAILIGHPIDVPAVTAAIKQGLDVTPILNDLRAGNWEALGALAQA